MTLHKYFILPLKISILVGILVVAACTKSPTMEQVGIRLKFINTSPNAGLVQFKLNDNNAHTPPLKYLDTTGYLAFEGGSYNLSVFEGSAMRQASVVDFIPKASYSAFAVDSAGKLKISIINDDLNRQFIPLRANVRFINLSPNAGPLTLVTARNNDTLILSASRLFNDVEKARAISSFTQVPSNVYDLLLFSGASLVYKLPAQLLENFKAYTIYAKGFKGGTANQALSLGIVIHN